MSILSDAYILSFNGPPQTDMRYQFYYIHRKLYQQYVEDEDADGSRTI